MSRGVHYATHIAVGAALLAAGRCRRPAPFLAYVAVAGAGTGLLHVDHANKERSYHRRNR